MQVNARHLVLCSDEGADILILARSDARQADSLQEALWRAAAFADAGADLLFIDALGSVEEMRAFTQLGGAAAALPKVRWCSASTGSTTTASSTELCSLANMQARALCLEPAVHSSPYCVGIRGKTHHYGACQRNRQCTGQSHHMHAAMHAVALDC